MPFTWADGAVPAPTGSATSASATLSGTVASGDLICAVIGSPNTWVAPTISDTAGNTWTIIHGPNFGATLAACLSAKPSAGLTVTVSNGTGTWFLAVDRFAAGGFPVAVQTHSGISYGFGINWPTANSGSAGSGLFGVPAGALVYAGGWSAGNNMTFTAGSSAGAALTMHQAGNSGGSGFSEYTVNSAAGANYPGWSGSATVSLGTVSASFVLQNQAVRITSFSPVDAAPGASVTITGAGFTSASAVRFGGVASSYTVNSATQITATVPTGGLSGFITVTAPGGTATSVLRFWVDALTYSAGGSPSNIRVDGGLYGWTTDEYNSAQSLAIASDSTATTNTRNMKITQSSISVPFNGAPGGMPALWVGNWFGAITTSNPLNIPVSSITGGGQLRAWLSFDYSQITAGSSYDAVFDIFFFPAPVTGNWPTGSQEMMIWLSWDGQISGGSGTFTRNLTVGGYTCDRNYSGGHTSVYLLKPNTDHVAALDIGLFAADQVAQGNIGSTWYLVYIAVGSEPYFSDQGMMLTDFTLAPPSPPEVPGATLPAISSIAPTDGPAGTTVTVTGSGFTGTTAVNFGAVPAASFTVNSDTKITAVTAAGTLNGRVSVTNVQGTASSTTLFWADNILVQGQPNFPTASLNGGTVILQSNEFGSTAAYTLACDGGLNFRVINSAVNTPVPGGPGAYPSLFVGNHFGVKTALNPFPLQVSAITRGGVVMSSVAGDLSLVTAPPAVYDFSYDIWFTVNPTDVNNATGHLEMMIWLSQVQLNDPGGGAIVGTVTISGYTFTVYWNGAGILVYLCAPFQSALNNIDIGLFAADAVARGYLSPAMWLIDVEAGFEDYVGGAGLSITNFNVSVNTGTAPFPGTSAPPGTGNCTVDLRTPANGGGPLVPVDPLGVGITLSGYSGGGTANILNAGWKAALQALAPATCRVPMAWFSGNPGIGAGGAQTAGNADAYIAAIKSIGATPFIVFLGDTSDNGFLTLADHGTSEFTAFVSHYNAGGGAHGGPVKYWVIGNEPDTQGVVGGFDYNANYTTYLPSLLSAGHAADSTIVMSAPAAGSWNPTLIQAAANAAGNAGLGILSYHAFDGGNIGGSGFPTDPQYYTHVKTDLPAYKAGIHYGVEEVNWNPAYGAPNTTQFYDWHNTLFIADAAGQVISAGGHFIMYSDSNGALGLLNDGAATNSQPGSFLQPLPAYWGIGIWTGMNGQFRRWSANMVPVTTTYAQGVLTVFASDNGKIVVCNKDTAAHPVTIGLGGTSSGTYNVWATNAASPQSPITEVVTAGAYSGSVIAYTVPAQTAVSIEVTDGGKSGGNTLLLVNSFEGGTAGAAVIAGTFGSGSPWDLVTATNASVVYAAHGAHGALAGQFSTTAAGGVASVSWTNNSVGQLVSLYGRAYIWLTAAPAVTDAVIQMMGASGSHAGNIQITTAQQLVMQTPGFVTAATFTSVIPVGQWVRVEWHIVAGAAGVGSLTVNYYASDDASTPAETHTDTANAWGGTGGITEVDFGWTNTHPSQPVMYLDDLALSGSGFPGPAGLTVSGALSLASAHIGGTSGTAGSGLTLVNNLESGSNGVTLNPGAAGNTGAAGQNFFDIVGVSATAACTFSSAHAAHGSLSMAVSTGGTASVAYAGWTTSLGARTSLFGRAYLYLTANPASPDRIIYFNGQGGTNAGGIQLTTTRQLQPQDTNFVQPFTFTSVIPLNTWVRVEWFVVTGAAGAASLDVRYYASLDSATITEEHIDATGVYGGSGGIAEVAFGWTGSHVNQPLTYIDEVGLSTVGWLGPYNVTPAVISAAGSLSVAAVAGAGTGSLGGTKPPTPTVQLLNGFETGLPSGTPLTGGAAGNTAGPGQNYLDTVNEGPGPATCQFLGGASAGTDLYANLYETAYGQAGAPASSPFPAHGNLCMAVATGATPAVASVSWSAQLGSQPVLYGRAYIRFPVSYPATPDLVVAFEGAAGTGGGGIGVNAAGQLYLVTAAGATAVSFASVIPLNTYVRVEWHVVAGTPGALTVNYYAVMDSGTVTETQTDSAGSYGVAGVVAEVEFGWTTANAGQPQMLMDDLGLSGSGYLGPAGTQAGGPVTGSGGLALTVAGIGGIASTAAGFITSIGGLSMAPAGVGGQASQTGVAPPPPPPGAVVPPPASVPVFTFGAGFGAVAGQAPVYTDLSARLRNFQLQRQSTREQGPLFTYQPGTLSAALKNGDGALDPDNLQGPYVSTTGLLAQTVKLTAAGSGVWTAPANLVGTIDVTCVAGGGGGGGASSVSFIYNGGGGGGAEYAEETALLVTPGQAYAWTIGAPGAGGAAGANGSPGAATSFTGNLVTVLAHGGQGGLHGTTAGGGQQGTGGLGGTGSANTLVNAGGQGGPGGGAWKFPGGGGGGGGSGGSGAPGNPGGAASATYPGYGAAAVPGGGAGGGRQSAGFHNVGFAPGGGGVGGEGKNGGSAGAPGWIIIRYVVSVPASAATEVTGNVPVQLGAWWPVAGSGMFSYLFTGYSDSWQDSGQNVPGYAETTVSATDAMKFLGTAFLPATGATGAGEGSGSRIQRILTAVGWDPALASVTEGDTSVQAAVMGDYALSLMQVTADTEGGELYIDPAGKVFFRHRDGLLEDFRSAFPCAVFSDVANGPGPSGSYGWWTWEDGSTDSWVGFNANISNDTFWAYGPGATKSLLVQATAAAAAAGNWGATSWGLPVVPGELHGAEATVFQFGFGGAGPPVRVTITIDWHDANDTYISSSLSPDAVTVPAGQTVHLSVQGQRAPKGAAFAHVTITDVDGSLINTAFWVDYVLFDPALQYTQPTRANDITTLANDVQFTRAGAAATALQEARSPAAIAANQGAVVSYQRTDLIFNTDADTLAAAQWVLSVAVASEDRLDALEILPKRDPYGLMPHILQRQIGDRIRFIRHPPGMITPVVRDLYIVGIALSYDASAGTLQLTWQTRDCAKYGAYIVLDDPVAGRADYGGLAY